MKNVVVLAKAADDLNGAREFYDAQEAGLGEYCVASVFDAVDRLAVFSSVHARRFGYHRMIAAPFPLGIYYREDRGAALIIAILDLRRHPNWIQKQLRRRPNN